MWGSAGPFRPYMARVRGLLKRTRYNQAIIDTLSAESWTAATAQAKPSTTKAGARRDHTALQLKEAHTALRDIQSKLRQ